MTKKTTISSIGEAMEDQSNNSTNLNPSLDAEFAVPIMCTPGEKRPHQRLINKFIV